MSYSSSKSQFGNLLKIQRTVYDNFLVTQTKVRYKSSKSRSLSFKHYDEKLDCSISRARTQIFNIVYFNKFEYFFTQTINSKFDRTDLKFLVTRFNNIVRDLRKIYKDKNFYYCVIPELHDDDKSWHLHGFLSKDFDIDSYINVHGFKELKHFDLLGWNSISRIRNYNACIKYCGAYITKDLAKSRKVGERLYYASQGLLRENVVDKKIITQIAPIHFDFKNEFVYKTTISLQDYYNMITNLDNSNSCSYYNIST